MALRFQLLTVATRLMRDTTWLLLYSCTMFTPCPDHKKSTCHTFAHFKSTCHTSSTPQALPLMLSCSPSSGLVSFTSRVPSLCSTALELQAGAGSSPDESGPNGGIPFPAGRRPGHTHEQCATQDNPSFCLPEAMPEQALATAPRQLPSACTR